MSIQIIEVPVKVTKEAHDISKAVLTIVKAAKQAGADGFQAGQDLSEVAMKSWADLVEAVKGVGNIVDEAKEAPARMVAALVVDVPEIVEVLLAPDQPAAGLQAQEAPAEEAAAAPAPEAAAEEPKA